MVEGVGSQFQAHGNMPVMQIENKLVKVSVANQDKLNATAVQVAALPHECQKGRVDEELFVAVRLRCRSV